MLVFSEGPMQSEIVKALKMSTSPVAILWSDTAPADALQFKAGRWGCVASVFATVATRRKTGVFSRETYGCWGGGVGLGFGNQYKVFPGGVDGFCGFLSSGNHDSETGRQIGAGIAASGGKQLADDFLHGERYLKSPEVTRQFLDALPMRDIPAKYVIVQPLEQCDPACDDIKSVTFFAEPHALSALVILANHAGPGLENVAIPYAAACQVIGILAYRELEREHPRALVGITDISARKHVRGSLGPHIMSFTAPWPVFLRMEANVATAFFERETWPALHG